MILSVTVNLKEIEEKGRNYRWIRPEVCLRCKGSHLWGHGFVESWFDGYVHALLLRRYICPLCGCVIKLKPQGYFKRFQATIERIRFHIVKRLKSGNGLRAVAVSVAVIGLEALRGKLWHTWALSGWDNCPRPLTGLLRWAKSLYPALFNLH